MGTYCDTDDVRRVTSLESSVVSDADVEEMILDAEAYVDEWTGKKYESTVYTEYHEGSRRTAEVTDSVKEGAFYDIPIEEERMILLNNYPVISITSLLWLDDDGETNTTLVENTDYHLWTETGKIWMFTKKIPFGMNKLKVKIVYNAGTATVPRNIQRLTSVIAGINMLVYQIGGTYNDVTSYSLPDGINVALGEPWTQIRETIVRLEKERDRLFNIVGRKTRSVIV